MRRSLAHGLLLLVLFLGEGVAVRAPSDIAWAAHVRHTAAAARLSLGENTTRPLTP